MTSLSKIVLAGAIALGFAAAPVAAGAAVLVNGKFESGGGSLAGWTVTNAVQTATGANYSGCCGTFGSEPAFSSNHFATFGGGNVTSVNSIEQGFATVAGNSYLAKFDFGAVGNGSQAIDYLINGVMIGSVIPNANNNFDTTFGSFSFGFIGTGSVMTIGFRNSSFADATDPIIDNVSVSAAPEPASWAMMIAGFGLIGASMRRNKRQPARI